MIGLNACVSQRYTGCFRYVQPVVEVLTELPEISILFDEKRACAANGIAKMKIIARMIMKIARKSKAFSLTLPFLDLTELFLLRLIICGTSPSFEYCIDVMPAVLHGRPSRAQFLE